MTKAEAIKTLRELWRETNDSWYEEAYNMAIEALEERPKGKWIYQESENIEKIYLCSNCKNYEAWGETEKTPYCPNCGADMRGDADD